MSEMTANHEQRNENHKNAEKTAQDLHESVEIDLGMWEVDGIICDLSVICKMQNHAQGLTY